jgi:hypothetical protein
MDWPCELGILAGFVLGFAVGNGWMNWIGHP